jgi:hypothetical protein
VATLAHNRGGVAAIVATVLATVIGIAVGSIPTAAADAAPPPPRHQLALDHDHAGTVAQVACSPRPRVQLTTSSSGTDTLSVTVAVSGSGNALQAIRFGAARNAVIDLPGGPTGSAGNVNQTYPAGTAQATFAVRRAGGAMTVPFTVVDDCGDWRTFVGGGAALGQTTPTAPSGLAGRPCPESLHNVTRWHGAVDPRTGCYYGHEHGDPPPDWVRAYEAAHGGQFSFVGPFNTSAMENGHKHNAMKAVRQTGVYGEESYLRYHWATNPTDRSQTRYHSYQLWVRDRQGGVSRIPQWVNMGDPHVGSPDRANGTECTAEDFPQIHRPLWAGITECYLRTTGQTFENSYSAADNPDWQPVFALSATATTFVVPGEESVTDYSQMRRTGFDGTKVRRIEIELPGHVNATDMRNRLGAQGVDPANFVASQFGEIMTGGTGDPRCGQPVQMYGQTYTRICLPQSVAPTFEGADSTAIHDYDNGNGSVGFPD